MGKKDEENEEEGSIVSKALRFALDYIFSMIIPVAILVYAAPNKSVDFVVESVKEKADLVLDVNFADVQDAITEVFKETLPMFEAEIQAINTVFSQPWGTYFSGAYSWVEVLPWQVAAGSATVLLLAVLFFPWRSLATWTANTVWRTVFLFIGMMPVDDGVSILSDKEAGNYRIFVTVAAAILTLIANYLTWILFWAVLRFSFRGLIGLVWGAAKPKRDGKKKPKAESHKVVKSVEISAAEPSETKKDI